MQEDFCLVIVNVDLTMAKYVPQKCQKHQIFRYQM